MKDLLGLSPGIDGHDPEGERTDANVGQAGPAEPAGDVAAFGEDADGFGEIAKGAFGPGDEAGGREHEPEGIERVKRPLPAAAGQGELEAGEAAAGLEHAGDLAETLVEVDEITQAEAHRGRVERVAGEGQALRVAPDEGDPAVPDGGPAGLLPAGRHHGLVQIADDRGPSGPGFPGRPEREIARPAANVEDAIAGPELQAPDGRPLPQEMKPQTENGVGPVVASGDAVELVLDE